MASKLYLLEAGRDTIARANWTFVSMHLKMKPRESKIEEESTFRNNTIDMHADIMTKQGAYHLT